jgi:AAA family ATP:ADP antiporter
MSAENARPAGLGRLLGRLAQIEPRETAAVVTAFLLFFCVLGGYFAVRPVRETIGTILGKERVTDLYVITWIASLAIVPAYGALCARFRRTAFLPWIYGAVAVSLAGVALVFSRDEQSIATGQFFYVFISVLNLFLVSVFWSFLLELFTADQTRRLFGVIAAGGTTGALVGPVMTDLTVPFIGNSGILFLGSAFFVAAIVCQRMLLKIWATADVGSGQPRGEDRPMGGNPFAGFTIVLRSPYLLGITLFVILLASVNTFLYFEQLRLVSETFADTETRTRVFSRLDYIVQTLTVISQLLITGRLASRLGVVALLTLLPLVMVAGFLTLAAFNTFWVLAVVFVARRVGEYSFIRPGREMLFSRVDTETKYKAKNLIDVPVYRGGDALSAQVKNALEVGGLSAAGIAVLGAGLAAAWALNGWWLGRRERLEGRAQGATGVA